MKYTTIFTAVAMLLTTTLAAPHPEAEANPQICTCPHEGCWDNCGQKLCCPWCKSATIVLFEGFRDALQVPQWEKGRVWTNEGWLIPKHLKLRNAFDLHLNPRTVWIYGGFKGWRNVISIYMGCDPNCVSSYHYYWPVVNSKTPLVRISLVRSVRHNIQSRGLFEQTCWKTMKWLTRTLLNGNFKVDSMLKG